jgi:hypothetical protein
MGVRLTVLTVEGLREADWPREAIEDLATMPGDLTREQLLNTVSWMVRGRAFDRIIPLDECDLAGVAEIREHLRIPGMGITTAGYYRDRLAMRVSARESGFPGPEFCRVLNYDELREFMELVPAPWVLQPRTRKPGAVPISVEDQEHLWRLLDQLGDLQSHYVLEQPLEGEQFSVQSILSERRVVFSVVLRHTLLAGGTPRVDTVDRSSRDWMELTALNGGLAPSLGMVRGVTEATFVRPQRPGREAHYFFDQIMAGVGFGVAAQVTEAASGLNLWREWARLEVAHLRATNYVPNEWFDHYGASLEWPVGMVAADAGELAAREVHSRTQDQQRERILFKSSRLERVQALAGGLAGKIADAAACR